MRTARSSLNIYCFYYDKVDAKSPLPGKRLERGLFSAVDYQAVTDVREWVVETLGSCASRLLRVMGQDSRES